jgi:asparagine synthase (glutamine-hydrolysing)
MCGLLGYISKDKFDYSKLLSTLSHRGPDDEGKYEHFSNNKNILLAHKRLSVLDLSSAGHQPMISNSGETIIIYNGEVYNFLELKSKFFTGTKFKSDTDTEVILRLYEKLGEKFVDKLEGDFALAIYDKRINKLFLYRDRLGVKPIYFFYNNDTFFFASELKPFIATGLQGNLSEEQLMNYFVFKYSPQNFTLFSNIKKLPPGSYVKLSIPGMKIDVQKYWQPKYECVEKIKFEEAKENIYTLLEDAVSKRLISDVPIGTFFSGGVDSSIIAYYLKNNKKITHYTAKKSEKDLKEEGTTSDFSYALKLADEWNLNMKQIDIGSSEANLDLINKTNYYSDDLLADGSQIPSFLIAKEAEKTSTVLLSGMGADEIFLGYGNHLLALISNYFDMSPKLIVNLFLSILKNLKQGRGYFKGYKRFLKKIGKYYNYPSYKYGLYSIVGDFENSHSILNISNDSAIKVFENYFDNANDPFKNIQRFEIENFLVKNLNYLDRMCMANSVEGRVPFMDHKLVEYAIKLPRKFKLNNFGLQKNILKKTFENKLPKEILYRRKAGFGMPLRSIFKDENKVNKLIDFDFINSFSYFNDNHIKKLIINHSKGLEDNSAIIYSIVSFQSWYKTHLT